MAHGLGRGLSSLIPSRKVIQTISPDEVSSSAKLIDVPVKNIRPNPKQPREDFGYQDLEDLI
ncbi:MAG: hypothetical protein Q8K55_16250, partial [Gemmatimonadaceae bacterium]|nr:hypothetical protein [Gemmatimonadaceae bacterium]